MMKQRVLSLLLMLLTLSSYAQNQAAQIPADPEFRIGVLDNGITYYIRHNEEPKDRASFYIIQNVGATLENDDQNGLAHFLEHMAFNGLENFPGKNMLEMLANNGIEFGRNINAYTSLNETVYNISDVPTNTENQLVDSCLLILHDWCNGLQLTTEELDSERGVISEEWRTRRDAAFRMRSKFFPVLLKDSPYAVRDVIGSLDVIKNFKPETIKDFYHDWYRTDLQAIAIVGDFDAAEVEAKVKKLFSKIPAVENPRPRGQAVVPTFEDTRFVLATDKEASQSQVSMYIMHEGTPKEGKNLTYYRDTYTTGLVNSMASMRIRELLQSGTPPFISGNLALSGFVRGYDVMTLSATAKPSEEALALSSITEEAQRIIQHGFTQGELDRAKINMMTSLESSYKERNKISNDTYARMVVPAYLEGEGLSSSEFDLEFAKQVLPTITVEEVSKKFAAQYTQENRTIIITGPSDEETKHLTEEEALSIVKKSENTPVEAYKDEAVATTLIDHEVETGKIVAEKSLEAFDATEWTFENGAKLIYRFADYEKDQVLLSSYSYGGKSKINQDQLPSGEIMDSFLGAYGLGSFDAISLNKAMTGKIAGVTPWINEIREGINGSCSPKDFETMMQLLYLRFEEPRFDTEAHNTLLSRYIPYVANIENDPKKAIGDSLSMILSSNSPRTMLFNKELLNKVNIKDIESIYRERFNDAEDFTFFIVGNIDKETVKAMGAQYIGSLKSDSKEKEAWTDHNTHQPKGDVNKVIPIAFTTEKANVQIAYSLQKEMSLKQQMTMRILKGVLDLRFTEEVREKEGGTYGVGIGTGYQPNPSPESTVRIQFDCDPDKADHLTSVIYREILKVAKEGPIDADMKKVTGIMAKNRVQSKPHNSYWLSALSTYYYIGYNPALEENYEEILESISAKDVQKAAKVFFKKADRTRVTFTSNGAK